MPLEIFMQVFHILLIQHLLLLLVIYLDCYWLSSYSSACVLLLLLLWPPLSQNWRLELVQLGQPIGLSFWSSTTYLLWSDPALRLFPECRMQWASSHGMRPDFGHKISPTASRQGLRPVSHLFCWIIRDTGYPKVDFIKALSKCTFLIQLNPLLLAVLKTC